jgi:flagellar export protein FliJ
MKPKFTLQPILDYRHSLVEVLEVELGRLLFNQRRGRELLRALVEMKLRLYSDLEGIQQGEIDLVKIAQVRANLQTIGQSIEQQEAMLEDLAKKIDSKQAEVVEGRKNEEMLVTLKRKMFERYQGELAFQENRMQDDVYISQAHRRVIGAA